MTVVERAWGFYKVLDVGSGWTVKELEFNENYLPIERMRLLQNSMDKSFMAAMIKGGNAAFELVKQEKENFDMLHWIDHFNEYSEQSK